MKKQENPKQASWADADSGTSFAARQLFKISLILILISTPARAAEAPAIYDSPEGGFTLQAPAGWEIKKEATEKFPTISGPKDDDHAPYVVLSEVTGTSDVFALGNATVKEMLKNPIYQLAARDAFFTADQRQGLKYVLTAGTSNGAYRQVYYLIEGSGGKFTAILATVPESGWKRYEQDLDYLAKSFRRRSVAPAAGVPGAPAKPAVDAAPATASGNRTAAPPVPLPPRGAVPGK